MKPSLQEILSPSFARPPLNDAKVYSVLHVDREAIAYNYAYLVNKVKPALCSAVLKADAYGLGALEVMPTLIHLGCQHIFVAYYDEGIQLREKLRSIGADENINIYVLNGLFETSESCFTDYNLTPVLTDLGTLERWQQYASQQEHLVPAVLHVDTGITRCGLPFYEFETLLAEPHRLEGIQLRLLMSHLACGDQPNHEYNNQQLVHFSRFQQYFPFLPASLANSGGIFLGRDFYFNLVRPGRALYGITCSPESQAVLRPVASLWSRVYQIQYASKGTSVGYAQSHVLQHSARLATVAMGYADGYPWSSQNAGFVAIHGYEAPVVGRISMDLITVDVTHIPEELVHPGSWCQLIGPDVPLDRVSQQAKTIPHEIFLRLGKRLKRVYSGGKEETC